MSTVRAVSGRQTRLTLSPSEEFDQLDARATPWQPAEAVDLKLILEDDTYTVTIQFKVARLRKLASREMRKVSITDANDSATRCTLAYTGREWRLIFASNVEITDKG